jgi:1-phosphatidylinositol phosphodiesterase
VGRGGWLLALLLCLISEARGGDNSNWMTFLKDNKSLASLSIPGTHDSGATHERWPSTTKCQTLTIPQQLRAGVRYLDIRCHEEKRGFEIYHGPVDQHLSFEGVVDACVGFLESNPGECVIMAIQEEYRQPGEDSRLFEKIFDGYLASRRDKWFLKPWIPTLGEARGKIVLLRRFASNDDQKGIDATSWIDDTNSVIRCGSTEIHIQDQYVVKRRGGKLRAALDFYNQALHSNPGWLFINYTSGYKTYLRGIPRIRTVAHFMNPKINAYFSQGRRGRFGITPMDFVDPDTCAKIIDTNFQ